VGGQFVFPWELALEDLTQYPRFSPEFEGNEELALAGILGKRGEGAHGYVADQGGRALGRLHFGQNELLALAERRDHNCKDPWLREDPPEIEWWGCQFPHRPLRARPHTMRSRR